MLVHEEYGHSNGVVVKPRTSECLNVQDRLRDYLVSVEGSCRRKPLMLVSLHTDISSVLSLTLGTEKGGFAYIEPSPYG